jgi:flagellar hook-length control protein FliK
MEMTMKQEIPANFPFPVANGPSSNLAGNIRKQGATPEKPEQGSSDFSDRLSVALDQSTNRQSSGGKTVDKRKPNELTQPDTEEKETGLPVAIIPGLVENANMLLDVGAELLTGIKDVAIQSVSAAVLPQVPQLLAVADQVFNSGPSVEQTGKSSFDDLVNVLPEQHGNNLPPSVAAVTNPVVSTDDLIQAGPLLVSADTEVVNPAAPNSAAPNPTIVTNSFSGEQTPFTRATSPSNMVPAPTTDSSAVPTSTNVEKPVVEVFPAPNLNEAGMVGQKISPDPASPLQNLIQQDLVAVQIKQNPIGQTNETQLAAKPEETDTETAGPVARLTDDAIQAGVATSEQKDLPKQSLAQTESEQKPILSEKQDSSAMSPVLFDKVLVSGTEMPVATPPPAPPRQDLHDVTRQVMEGMISPNQQLKTSQVIITLKPEHLGEVTVKINVDGDKVTAAFHAASSEVRAILESSLPQLRQEMSQQGWQFDSNGVFGGMQEFMGDQAQQQAQQQQMRGMTNHARKDEYENTQSFTNTGRMQVMSAAAVDYRI